MNRPCLLLFVFRSWPPGGSADCHDGIQASKMEKNNNDLAVDATMPSDDKILTNCLLMTLLCLGL